MISDCPDCDGTYTGTRCRCGYEVEIKVLRDTTSKEPLVSASEDVKEQCRELIAAMKIPDPTPKHEKPSIDREIKRIPANQDYFRRKGWQV